MKKIEIDLISWEDSIVPINTSQVNKDKAEIDLYYDMRNLCGYDDKEIKDYISSLEQNDDELSNNFIR